jgi:uncharacterized protein (DUF885 family)
MRTTIAAEDLPDGKAYYRAKVREFTTLDMDPAAIHDLGVAEVARLHAEMLTAMRASGFKGEFAAFLAMLRTDPRFYAKTPEELLMRAAWVAKRFDGKAAQFFGYLPRARFAIKPVPEHRRTRRTGCLPSQHLRPEEPAAVQPHRAHAARVRARSCIPDADCHGAQGSARISPAELRVRVRGGLGAVLRAAGT